MSTGNQDVPDHENPPLGESPPPQYPGEENSPIIYRVPEPLRCINPQAYIPRIVSIGPLHHDKQHLQHMEEGKRKYLDYFILRTKASKDTYTQLIRQKKRELRACYEETINFDDDKFVEIILVDAAFIIVLLLGIISPDVRVIDDSIFGKQWKLQEIWLDILLAENQLPHFILEDLLNHMGGVNLDGSNANLRTVDLFRVFSKQLVRAEGTPVAEASGIEHFVDFLRRIYIHGVEKEREKFEGSIPSVTTLYQAGVKIDVVSSRNLNELKFENGILKIPQAFTDHETYVSISNLLAFEQRRHPESLIIRDYVALLNLLIQTPEDEELLVKKEIFKKDLDVRSLFKKLSSGIITSDESCFHGLIKQLNDHCGKRRSKLRVYLMKNIINTKWATLSFQIVVISFILTWIQTVFAVISANSSNPNGQHR